MTVKELIQKLNLEDPNKRIVVFGYEGGYDELDKIDYVALAPDSGKKDKWWLGEFKECIQNQSSESEVAILLPRKS